MDSSMLLKCKNRSSKSIRTSLSPLHRKPPAILIRKFSLKSQRVILSENDITLNISKKLLCTYFLCVLFNAMK